jgi:hypothetical protein
MRRDKITITVLISGLISLSFYSWYPEVEIKDVVRSSLVVALCVFLFLGHSWARWVVGVLSAMGAVLSLLLLGSIQATFNQLAPLILVGLFYVFAAYVLLNPNKLKSHFSNAST